MLLFCDLQLFFLFLVNSTSRLACVPVLNGVLHSVNQTVIFRGEHCQVLSIYYDYTNNTAFCSLRELRNSRVQLTVPANLLMLVLPGSPGKTCPNSIDEQNGLDRFDEPSVHFVLFRSFRRTIWRRKSCVLRIQLAEKLSRPNQENRETRQDNI